MVLPAQKSINNSNHLLICEDDEDQAKYLSLLLQSAGFHCDIALTVNQAKTFLLEKEYSALLLDLILPDQDGISFIRELRDSEKTRSLPIIVISIIAQSGRDLLSGEVFAVIDWLTKPLNFNRLLLAISNIKKLTEPRLPRILHVEDDLDTQRIIATLLDSHSEITFVETLQGAREQLAKNNFDLVILDLLLPDGNGKELLPLFAKYKLPIIVFSSMHLDPKYAECVSEALVKSENSKEELLSTINNLLKNLEKGK